MNRGKSETVAEEGNLLTPRGLKDEWRHSRKRGKRGRGTHLTQQLGSPQREYLEDLALGSSLCLG